jgi:hypothetical protein
MMMRLMLISVILLAFHASHACPGGPEGAKCRAEVPKCPDGGANAKCGAEVATCIGKADEDDCFEKTVRKHNDLACMRQIFASKNSTTVRALVGNGMSEYEISFVPNSDFLSVINQSGGVPNRLDHFLIAPNGRRINLQENGNCESVSNHDFREVIRQLANRESQTKCPGGLPGSKCGQSLTKLQVACAKYIDQKIAKPNSKTIQ